MSFYGGRPGKSFTIYKVFNNYPELYQDMVDSNLEETDIRLLEVPENAFVLINYGTPGSQEFKDNKNYEDVWFELHPDVKPSVALGDYNATLWWDMNQPGNYNSTIWLKRFSEKGFYYSYIGNIGAIFPQISNTTGNWVIPVGTAAGEYDTGIQAQAREIEFEIEENRVYQNTLFKQEIINTLNEVEDDLPSTPIYQYGLVNIYDKYKFNELTNRYDSNPEGTHYRIYLSNENGEYIYNEYDEIQGIPTIEKEEDGFTYTDLTDWIKITDIVDSNFPSDKLKWRFIDSLDDKGNKLWTDLFDITGILSLGEYRQEVLMASQKVEDHYFQIEETSKAIDIIKEEIDETSKELGKQVDIAAGYSKEALAANQSIEETVNRFEDIVANNSDVDASGVVALAEIDKSAADFASLSSRLSQMPYQFDTISQMQQCSTLSREDKVFTFGMDNIGDGDSSKLFQIFDPNNEEDAERLNEVVENSITEENPEGEKVIEEQYPLANGLVAGLLTIFSGYGSGGGGGSAVPSLTVTGSEFALQDGEVIDIEYYWTGPNAGTATLFVTDSNRNSPKVVDYYDPSKVYSSGVQLSGFGSGKISLQPIRGEHNYTIYIIDRAQSYSNEVKVKVTVGGISLTVNYPDGKSFTSDQAVTYQYSVSTIYPKPSILQYTLYQGDQVFEEGEVKSTSNASTQYIALTLKTTSQNIGAGEFRVVARAYVEGDDSITTPYITRNFVIMEHNVIYLTTSFDGDASPFQQDTVGYVPFELIYAGGSNFEIEGRYSAEPNFIWEEASIIPPGDKPKLNSAGPFNYTVIMPELGTYYFRFRVKSTVDSTISGESRELKINVIEKTSKYQLRQAGAIQAHYSARRGQTNEANKHRWKNISTENSGYDATLVNFNYLSNGWETKEILTESGGTIIQPTGYLHCNSETYVATAYPFFSSITNTQGGSCEIVFKAADIGKDQTVLAMEYAQGSGFYIYKNKIVFNSSLWNVSNLTAYYNLDGVEEENKPIHVTLTVDPKERYIKIYVNGVLTKASATMSFTQIPSSTGTTTYINRAVSGEPNYGVTKVDCLRFYSTALSSYDVLCNYQYNLRDEKEQVAFGLKNFLDSESEDTIPSEIPYMTFYLTKAQWETMDKDNVKPSIKVAFHDPNPAEGNEMDYVWEGVKTSWQGTSSIAYPVKNFKIKLPSKYYLKGKNQSLAEKTFCLKADYMDSSHCHNTGNVNFIHQTGLLSNYALTPPQSKELGVEIKDGYQGLAQLKEMKDDEGNIKYPHIQSKRVGELKNRTTIDGYPIVLYICLETDESAAIENNPNKEYEAPKFWGIYNFNLDKGSTDSFGLRRDEDDFQNVTSFEIAANSAYSGGGFRAMRFVKRIDKEEYGWTKWNITYQEDKTIDLKNGKNLQVNIAYASGEIKSENRTISFSEDENDYKGIYNKNRNLKGIYNPKARYTEFGSPDSNGRYIMLFKLNDETDRFAYEIELDANNNIISKSKIVLGYYLYDPVDWSENVPKDQVLITPKTEWQLQEMPQNQDFKYEYYETDFELRFPDEDIFLTKDKKKNQLYYKEYDKLIALVEWVDNVDTNFNFKEEFSDHFDEDTVINYYLMLMTVGLIDNFGKNLMIDTWGYDKNGEIPYLTYEKDGKIYHKVWKYNYDNNSMTYGLMDTELNDNGLYNVYSLEENTLELIEEAPFTEFGDDGEMIGWYHETDYSKYIWYPHFYDLDSCLGVNNSGVVSFSPSIEMEDQFYINDNGDTIDNAPFNTSSSALWQKFVRNYQLELAERYLELVAKQIFTVDTFAKYYYDNIVDALGPRMYNNDAYPKYLSREEIKVIVAGQVTSRLPYAYDHLATGNDWDRIQSWLRQRLTYLYTMFKQTDPDNTGGFELRTEHPDKPYRIEFECYEPMYMRVVRKNGEKAVPFRLTKANGIATFDVPEGTSATDQEVYIMPGYNVKSFKEVTKPQLGFSGAKLDNATKLLEINLANSQGLTEFIYEKPSANLIRRLNFENCPALGTGKNGANIDMTYYPYLEYVNTLGTKAVFNFGNKGGILKEAYLEGSDILNVKNYPDLQNLTIQLTYSENPNTVEKLISKHNANYTDVVFENCSNPNFRFNIIGRYLNNSTNTYVSANTSVNDFIKQYGKLSLFPSITNLTLKNSTIDGEKTFEKQTQPNGSIENVKELKLALPKLKKLEIVNGENAASVKYNKIALLSLKKTDLSNEEGAFPGWGQSPEIDNNNYGAGDNNFIVGKLEGIIADKYVEELELRAPYRLDDIERNLKDSTIPLPLPPTGNEFKFPWRTYLGHLPGLKRLKFNTKIISPKLVKYDSFETDGDKYYFTKPNNIPASTTASWTPNRFELILPSASAENQLNLIYFSPEASDITFTCIRQPNLNKGEYGKYIQSTQNGPISFVYPKNWPLEANNYFEEIKGGDPSTEKEEATFAVFKGVDLRGYEDLTMNFKGLTKIKGILGMNALNVASIAKNFSDDNNNDAFRRYFYNCKALSSFFITDFLEAETQNSATTYLYEKWDFAPWFNSSEKAQYLANIEEFFSGCKELSDAKYLTGLLNPRAFKIINAKYLFKDTGFTKIKLDWTDKGCLENIEGMFSGCTALTEAEINIFNLSKVTSLNEFFFKNENLNKVNLVLLSEMGEGYFKNIQTIDSMFQGCSRGLTEIDFSKTTEDNLQLYDFNNLISAANLFESCLKLNKIKFPNKANFQKLESLAFAFSKCEALEHIFEMDEENAPIFYDSSISTNSLNLESLFNGCKKLTSIGCFTSLDLRRVNNITNIFKQCHVLSQFDNGVLDLSRIKFSDYIIAEGAFNECQSIQELILPPLKLSEVFCLFKNCYSLHTLDITNLIPCALNEDGQEEGLSSFAEMFWNCKVLGSKDQISTEMGARKFKFDFNKWDMTNATNLSHMFDGCLDIKSLDFSNWKLPNKEDREVTLSSMFNSCSSLQILTGLNEWFGTAKEVDGTVKSGRFSSKGVEYLFSGCSNLDFSTINLSAWARMAIPITTIEGMFKGCTNLKDLNYVFSGKKTGEKISNNLLRWGGHRNAVGLEDCTFTNLTNFHQFCWGTGLTEFSYFSTSNNIALQAPENINSPYTLPTVLTQMTAGCKNLKTFTFTPLGAGMHNVGVLGDTFFQDCGSLINITFPDVSSRNLGIKASFGLAGVMSTDETFMYFENLNIANWLQTLPAESTNPNIGMLTLSSKQKDYFDSTSEGIAKWQAIKAKKWGRAGES